MAYAFVTASSQYLQAGAAAVTALPFSFAAWFNASTNHTGAILGINEIGSTPRAILFAISDGAVQLSCDQPTPISKTTGTYATGTWHHIAGVATTNIWQCYLDGITNGAPNDTTAPFSFASCNRTAIGMRISSTAGSFFNGSIAEAAIWNVVLDAAELAALAKGFNPALIRPASLVFYVPLVRELVVPKGGSAFALSNVGAATVSPHPRVIMPRKRRRGFVVPPPPPETLFAQACL